MSLSGGAPRDPATDQSNLVDWQTLGSELPVALGRARRVTRAVDPSTGRPSAWRNPPVMVQERNLSLAAAAPPRVSPGTIRRNVVYPIAGGGGRGLFSSTANAAPGGPGRMFEVTNHARYLISSLALGLSSPLKWPITGVKPLIPTGPEGRVTRQMAGPSTGWPVVAPQVPSYGSRIPLLRPRGLVSDSGS